MRLADPANRLYFPNLHPWVDPNCDFLFTGGGGWCEEEILREFGVCVWENKLSQNK